MSPASVPTIEWLGCATFRLRLRDRILFFDAYLDGDRAPGGPLVGLAADQVDGADLVLVSHAHFDHVLGADTIAAGTGATVVGSHEVGHLMATAGLPRAQILAVSGGEPIAVGDDIRVRAFPALHSCLFATERTRDAGTECVGDLGVDARQRVKVEEDLLTVPSELGEPVAGWAAPRMHRCSPRDGGQLAYLVETPDGSVLVSSSAGYWSGIVAGLRPDVAVLAASGRPNVDGEPYQGSLAGFLLGQVEALRPRRVVFSHHDALMDPLMTATDTGPAASLLADRAGYAPLLDLDYHEPRPLFP